MRNPGRWLTLALVLYAGADAPALQDQQRPIFRSDAHYVTVDAYPLKDGKVVEGLTAADFVVEEDGRPQTIESFEFVGSTPASPESFLADCLVLPGTRA